MNERRLFLVSEYTREERRSLMQLLIGKATNSASIEKVQLFGENDGGHNQVDQATVEMRRQKLGTMLTNPTLSQK